MEDYTKELQVREKKVRSNMKMHQESDLCTHDNSCKICENLRKELYEINLAFNELHK